MDKIFKSLDTRKDLVVELQRKLTAIPAIGPKNGGTGEKEKADFLMQYLKDMGISDIREFNAPDSSVPCGYRPNIAAVIPGRNTEKTLWVIGHIDIVPPGDLSLWNTDPYELVVEGDKLIGRGVEDNQQAIVSALLVAHELLEKDITPEFNYGMLFVADEETGSARGLGYMVEEHAEVFRKGDLFLVPDSGEPNGEAVEIAEKSSLWTKVVVEGRQCHASSPEQGNNTMYPSAALILKIRELEEIFDAEDPLYDPSRSTFQATKREANVENVNTIPGRDVFHVDSRILPEYKIEDVSARIREFADEVAEEYGVTITCIADKGEQAAPPTPENSEIALRTLKSVKKVYGNNPRFVGIGGGTVAAFLRRHGHDAVVWSTLHHNAHQPNEWALISNTIGDAKVFADMVLSN